MMQFYTKLYKQETRFFWKLYLHEVMENLTHYIFDLVEKEHKMIARLDIFSECIIKAKNNK